MMIKLMPVLAVVAVALLVLAGVVIAAEPQPPSEPSAVAESVRITVGDITITGVAVGDVVHEGEIPSSSGGEAKCDVPGVRIQMSGDVRRVRVGLADGTCNLIVRELEFNSYAQPRLPPTPAAPLSSPVLRQDTSGTSSH